MINRIFLSSRKKKLRTCNLTEKFGVARKKKNYELLLILFYLFDHKRPKVSYGGKKMKMSSQSFYFHWGVCQCSLLKWKQRKFWEIPSLPEISTNLKSKSFIIVVVLFKSLKNFINVHDHTVWQWQRLTQGEMKWGEKVA